ncbi:MAG: 5'-3' exonuclease H3TH domain-containing protein [Opitutaceae bacterium]|jgi:DNA polymerase-1
MKALLIDGFNLAYRCFFAIPELTRSDGFPTNALHGWVKSIWKLADQEKPDATGVFFDLGGSQDRLALHPEYKATRKEMPDALVLQLPHVKALTKAMGLKSVEQRGVESDDLLASEAVSLARDGNEVLIVSSDKDFAQIVGERIQIMLPPPTANPKLGWRRLDAAGVMEKYGVPPAQIPDYLSLIGDTSDNIPGVGGVGPKTAAKWLAAYGNIGEVIARAAELEPERFRLLVAAAADRLRLNLRLTTLNLAIPVVPLEKPAPQFAELARILEEMEMRSTLAEARERYGQPELF